MFEGFLCVMNNLLKLKLANSPPLLASSNLP